MKLRSFALTALLAAAPFGVQPSFAAIRQIDISPSAAAAANLGTVIYPGDHAPGLDASNESNQPNSPATGGELGTGVRYDDVSNQLTIDFGYGSAFGFVDLASDWASPLIHIHGNGTNTAQFPNPNTNAGVTVDLFPLHTPSGTRSGRVTGTVALTATQEQWLFNNQMYFNVHSVQNGGGEVRGQLVVVIPEPGAVCLALAAAAPLLGLARRRG
jgi:hypothetical protein